MILFNEVPRKGQFEDIEYQNRILKYYFYILFIYRERGKIKIAECRKSNGVCFS